MLTSISNILFVCECVCRVHVAGYSIEVNNVENTLAVLAMGKTPQKTRLSKRLVNNLVAHFVGFSNLCIIKSQVLSISDTGSGTSPTTENIQPMLIGLSASGKFATWM